MPLGTPLLPPLCFQLPPEESPLSPAGSLCPFRTIIPLICTNKPESLGAPEGKKRGWQTQHQVGIKQGRSDQGPLHLPKVPPLQTPVTTSSLRMRNAAVAATGSWDPQTLGSLRASSRLRLTFLSESGEEEPSRRRRDADLPIQRATLKLPGWLASFGRISPSPAKPATPRQTSRLSKGSWPRPFALPPPLARKAGGHRSSSPRYQEEQARVWPGSA